MSSQSREQQRRASAESNRHAAGAAAAPIQRTRSSSRAPAHHSRRRASAHPPVSYSPRDRNDMPDFRSNAEAGQLRESENKTQLLEQQLVLERREHENKDLQRQTSDQQKVIEEQKQRNESLETYLRERQEKDAEEEAKANTPKRLKNWQYDCIIGASTLFLVSVIAVILWLSITLNQQKSLIADFTKSGCRPL